MRVRIGRPLKAKSILGDQSRGVVSIGYPSNASTCIMLHDRRYFYQWRWDDANYGISVPAHKFFFYVRMKNVMTMRHSIAFGRDEQAIPVYKYNYYYTGKLTDERYCVVDNTAGTLQTLNNIHMYYENRYPDQKFDSSTDIPLYWMMVDLTDTFGAGNEPTEEEFYREYRQCFEALSSGKEVTLDQAAGKAADNGSLVPSAYIEADYIEGTGTQYVDTGYVPSVDTRIRTDFVHTEHVVDTPLFGVRKQDTSNSYTVWAHPLEYEGHPENTLIFNSAQYVFVGTGKPEGYKETIYVSKDMFVNNETTYVPSVSSGSPDASLVIFGLNNGG